jgi:HlyD family secretion protein
MRIHPFRLHHARLLPVVLLLALNGCSRNAPARWQGYFEGEFVQVSSPLPGRLEALSVAKGTRVAAGAPLFTLEHAAEADELRQANQTLELARAQLADLRKGSRPEEIEALEAKLGQSRATEETARLDYERESALFKSGAATASEFDHARLALEADRRASDENSAKLATARLGGRPDAVAAAEAAVRAAAEAEARARWNVEQKTQSAPTSALVYDTLYREGEFVAAGSPVVELLPPANLKVRFFVAEPDFALLEAGEHVSIEVEGRSAPIEGTVNYLSPEPEYTPPILYNQDNRAKLVYMVEASVAPEVAPDLHPGQPVTVVAADK